MIKEHDGQKKAQDFIEQNLQYSHFRKMAIESAMNKKDYDSVIKLTLDGEEKDKDMRGLVDPWMKYRYKAYKLSGKLDEQREIAMEFILDGSFEYYKELKSTYDSREWLSVYPKVIFLLEDQKKTYNEVYTRILIEEGENQKLLEYVKRRPPRKPILVYIIIIITKFFSGEGRGVTLMYQGFNALFCYYKKGTIWALGYNTPNTHYGYRCSSEQDPDKCFLSYSRPGNHYKLLRVQTPSEVFLRCLQRIFRHCFYTKFQGYLENGRQSKSDQIMARNSFEYQRRAKNI